MGKVIDGIKQYSNLFYNWRKRNEKIDNLIRCSEYSFSKIDDLQESFTQIEQQIDNVEKKLNSGLELLSTVKHGTKMELFETLHHFRQLYVVEKGWASCEEKKEVSEVYQVYHDRLSGNGAGEIYYKEIINLPESKEEKEARQKNV